jgi:hypothetical protein
VGDVEAGRASAGSRLTARPAVMAAGMGGPGGQAGGYGPATITSHGASGKARTPGDGRSTTDQTGMLLIVHRLLESSTAFIEKVPS